jgi:protein-L-isoaspartate(D-aspartate) O-methyltransferase
MTGPALSDRNRLQHSPASRPAGPLRLSSPSAASAYLTRRENSPDSTTGELRHEFGVGGHGRHGAGMARQLASHVQAWDRDRRHSPGSDFKLYPAGAAVPAPPEGRVFWKRHTQLVMAWP